MTKVTKHNYSAQLTWTGNQGSGTSRYSEYSRDHTIAIQGKPDLLCSSDPSFRGNPNRHNPEELLLISLSSCHMLWFLHLCATAKVIVTSYTDTPEGLMIEDKTGAGRFSEVRLYPDVGVKDSAMLEKIDELHTKANEHCFIANSVNFPILHFPKCYVSE